MFKVFALPDAVTQDYLAGVFQGSPILIDPDSFGIELGSSRAPVGPFPGNSYRALPGSMNIWYDSATQRSYWLLPLIPSPEMVLRHDQIGDAWGRDFLPVMRIAEVQNMRRRNVAWMKSIADGLASMRPILTFTNELVAEDNSIVPTHQDFYDDQIRKGPLPATLFAELASS